MNGKVNNADAQRLARDILSLARGTLLVHMRFLDGALARLELKEDPEVTLATDGQHIFYRFYHVIREYRTAPELMTRDYLHTVLHCVMRHPFVGERIDQSCWDLAADIAVEAAMTELDLPCVRCHKEAAQQETLQKLRGELKSLTAERIYRYFRLLPDDALDKLRAPFLADEHRDWYRPTTQEQEDKADDEVHDDGGEGDGTGDQPGDDEGDSQAGQPGEGDDGDERGQTATREETDKAWQEIARRMQTDLETFSKRFGDKAGTLTASIRSVTRERHDYSRFLKRFAHMSEVVGVNDEEFDYIFYTYGLTLYRNMPLVEPLEYKETPRIREFVIAIDTSASVQGERVRRFVEKTFDILRAQETYTERIDIHVLQCDAQIQQAVKLATREDMEDYCASLTLHGFGGTDFRPVFDYVRDRQAAGELTGLRGLIYLTDGEGRYPAAPPPYEAAFVFPDDTDAKVPPWAIKVSIDLDEL